MPCKCVRRPPGAIPEGNKAILPRPDEGDPYYEYARYGIATYDTPLSDQQMSEYDLKLLPREDSFDFPGEDTY